MKQCARRVKTGHIARRLTFDDARCFATFAGPVAETTRPCRLVERHSVTAEDEVLRAVVTTPRGLARYRAASGPSRRTRDANNQL